MKDKPQEMLVTVKEQGRWRVFVSLFGQGDESKEKQFPNSWHYTAQGYPPEAFLISVPSLTWTESGGIMTNTWAGVGQDGEMAGVQWAASAPFAHLTETVLPFTDLRALQPADYFPDCNLIPWHQWPCAWWRQPHQGESSHRDDVRFDRETHLKSPVPEKHELKRILIIQ